MYESLITLFFFFYVDINRGMIKMEKTIIGITNYNEIVTLEFNGIKSFRDGYYISAGFTSYDNLITEDEGYDNAYDTLIEPDYYTDIGYNLDELFKSFIDYDQLANYILNNEGWYNINGEYTELLGYNGDEYYGAFSVWYHQLDNVFKFVYIKSWELKKLRFYSRYFGCDNIHIDIIKEGCEFIEGLINKYNVSDERIMNDYLS